MLPSTVKENANAILEKAQEISSGHIKQISIAENEEIDDCGEYIEPYAIIVDTGGAFLENLIDFQSFLKKSLDDVGITISYKHLLEQNASTPGILNQISQNLLYTAIDIREIDPIKPWQEQFAAKKSLNTRKTQGQENKASEPALPNESEKDSIEEPVNKKARRTNPSTSSTSPKAIGLGTRSNIPVKSQ